ncbi:right-handed parallel beta-helix repeat-containing protein [Luteitalea sp.]|uniref:right-handed parallel beta-helix repeat-containing protein n=1 Tax=Luteitalea sp. TaxID=2004800 RepID=UPI0025B83744|nr:right-handed parallel beta-helix repeat-containing protein [Luteitalea sp.]
MTRTAFRLAFPTVVLAVSSLGVFAPSALANDEASGRWLMRSRIISQSGHYEVTRGFRADRRGGNGIVIAASDVTIDLGGYAIEGSATPGAGIRVMPGVSNVTITNGSLTGFRVGVDVTGATNVRIEGLQIKGGDMGGPPPGEIGVLIVNSRGVVVERNVVTGTFLGIFVRGAGSGGNRIGNNTLTGGSNGQLGICYNPDDSGVATGPSGDLVYDNLVSRFVVGIQTSVATAGNLFRDNSVAAFAQAVEEVTAGSNVFADNLSTVIVP